MAQIEVVPETMHTCAVAVDEAGNQFGRDAVTLGDQVSEAGLYGSDELGASLLEMDRAACPEALEYFTAAGEATCEAAGGIDRMAALYTRVEQDNTDAVDDVIDELGVF